MGFIIFLVVLGMLVTWTVILFNRLVSLRNRRETAFVDMDVQLRLRHDLVPQLVETVKGYAGHERETLTKVTEARSAAAAAKTIDDKIEAEKKLSAALQGLHVQLEAYPDLKANQNFLQLQQKLDEIENRLAATRNYFNSATMKYNNAVETFPSNLLAINFGFRRAVMFDLGVASREMMEEPPKVKF